jgi:hypothetical protein
VVDGSLSEKEKKLLFGLGTSMAFAIDTTGSMSDIIAAVQQQSIAIATARNGTSDEPNDYVIAPFNDPTTGPVYKTSDLDTFEADIKSLTAYGGGDCPELALTGMLDAMAVMDGPADLFVMTDAAAKDEDLASQVIATALDKRINLQIFKFDSGCDDGIDDGSASKRSFPRKRVDSAANRVYSLLATSTGGSYHSLARSDSSSISSLLNTLTLGDNSAIFKIADTTNGTTNVSYSLPVDSQMTEFSVSLRGSGFSMALTSPDGTALDTTASGVTLTTVGDGQFLNVKAPKSGKWTVALSGSGSFNCDATGVSPLHLSAFDFVTLGGRPGHTGYFPITGQPAYDHDVAAVARLDGDFSTATFDLRGPDNKHLVDCAMEAGSGEEGTPPTNAFYGEMRLVAGTLYAYCEGTDAAGAPFMRILPTVFTPFLSNTTVTGFNDTDIFAGLDLTPTNTTTSSSPSSSSSNTTTTTMTTANSTSTTTSSYYYTNSSFSSLSSTSKPTGYYPPNTHTWPHTAYIPPTLPGLRTHSQYISASSGDEISLSTIVTTSQYMDTVTSYDGTGMPHYIPTTAIKTITTVSAVVILCPTCKGPNYPQHTGSGPWKDVDVSVVASGWDGATDPTGADGGKGSWTDWSSSTVVKSSSALTRTTPVDGSKSSDLATDWTGVNSDGQPKPVSSASMSAKPTTAASAADTWSAGAAGYSSAAAAAATSSGSDGSWSATPAVAATAKSGTASMASASTSGWNASHTGVSPAQFTGAASAMHGHTVGTVLALAGLGVGVMAVAL